MADDAPRDNWGFTEADHAELKTLWDRHHARIPELMRQVVMQGGVTPEPDDPGVMGWVARVDLGAGQTRVFPKGGFWRLLLDELRAIDNEKGGV